MFKPSKLIKFAIPFLVLNAVAASALAGATSWKMEGQKKVFANGWKAEIQIRCMGGSKHNDTETILVLNNGRFQPVYSRGYDSLEAAAQDACGIN